MPLQVTNVIDLALGRMDPDELSEQQRETSWSQLSAAELSQAEADDPLLQQLKAALPVSVYCAEPELQDALRRAAQDIGNAATLDLASGNASTSPSGEQLAPVLPPGTMVRDYRLLNLLGRGGMGTVYRALHTRLDRIVAIKLVSQTHVASHSFTQRFDREMKAVGRLRHPHIVQALDAGQDEHGPYLVMEYIEGCDAAAVLKRAGRLSVADACEITRQAALGLQHAHEAHMVHRDIKPSNLMLTTAGELKLLDLGLARLQTDESHELTQTGQVMGTADYMAPEQGMDATTADIRADLYSLGCTLYALLTGSPPFSDIDHPTLKAKFLAHATLAPRDARRACPETPTAVGALLNRLLSKKPSERPATPGEVAQALAPYCASADLAALPKALESKGSTIRPTSLSAIAPTLIKKPPRRVGGLALVALGLLGFALVAAVVFYRIQTEQGTFVVEINDDQVAAKLMQDGLTIEDPAHKRTWTLCAAAQEKLPPGEYKLKMPPALQLEVTDDAGTTFKTGEFAIRRGGKVTARVTLLPTAGKPDTPRVVSRDREVAEWVLAATGTVKVELAGKVLYVPTSAELPSESFKLCQVNLLNAKIEPSQLGRLSGLQHLSELALTNQPVTDEHFARIQDLPKLQGLLLAGTELTAKAYRELHRFPELRILVANDGLPSNLLGYFAERMPKLWQFDFRDGDPQDEDLKRLAELKELRVFGIGGNVSKEGMQHIARAPALKQLHIHHSPTLRDEDFTALSAAPNLSIISFIGWKLPHLTPAAFDKLAAVPNLQELNGTGIPLAAEDWSRFEKYPALVRMQVGHSEYGDEIIPGLVRLPKLQALDLREGKFTKAGVEKLRAALPGCRIQSDFGTFEPTTTNVATSRDREVAEWVLNSGGQVGIQVQGSERRIAKLAELPSDAFQLVDANFLNSKVDLTQLGKLNGLQHLHTIGLTQQPVTDAQFAQLNDVPKLRKLGLAETKLTTNAYRELKRFKGLTYLGTNEQLSSSLIADFAVDHPMLQGFGIISHDLENEDLQHLIKMQQLTTFCAGGPLTTSGLRHIAKAPALHTLQLANCPDLTDADLKELESSKVSSLMMYGDSFPKLTPNALDVLAASRPQLQGLLFRGVAMKADDWNKLAAFKQLTWLNIGYAHYGDEVIPAISKLANLDTLILKEGKFTKAGIEKLHASLPGCRIESDFGTFEPTIANVPPSRDREVAEWMLSVGGEIYVRQGDEQIHLKQGMALPAGRWVIELLKFRLDRALDGQELARIDGLMELTYLGLGRQHNIKTEHLDRLQNLPKVSQLHLQGTSISDEGIRSLKRFSTLTTLAIDSHVQRDGRILADIVRNHKGLKHLSLDTRTVADEHIPGIEELTQLQTLVLAGVFTDKGLAHIAELKSIEDLELGSPAITDSGAGAIASLPKMHSLRFSGSRCTGLTPKSLDILAEKAAQLKFLAISAIPMQAADWDRLQPMGKLETLDVRETAYGDEAIPGIAKLTWLKRLMLNKTKFTQNGVNELHRLLPQCQIDSDFGILQPSALPQAKP